MYHLFLCSDGNLSIGTYVKDLPNGPGTAWYADGDIYAGEWKNDEFHGRGTLWSANGSVQVGQWAAGEFTGFGLEYDAHDRPTACKWKDGELMGLGVEWTSDRTTAFQVQVKKYKHYWERVKSGQLGSDDVQALLLKLVGGKASKLQEHFGILPPPRKPTPPAKPSLEDAIAQVREHCVTVTTEVPPSSDDVRAVGELLA